MTSHDVWELVGYSGPTEYKCLPLFKPLAAIQGLRGSCLPSTPTPEHRGSWCSLHSPRCLSVHKISSNISQTLRETALAVVPPLLTLPVLTQAYQITLRWKEHQLSGGLGNVSLASKPLNFRIVHHDKVRICAQRGVTVFQAYFYILYGCFAFTYTCASHRGLVVKKWLKPEG